MLGEILEKETCAGCRWCCSFRRMSLGETPRFAPDAVARIRGRFPDVAFVEGADGASKTRWLRYDLRGSYRTDDPAEEAPCPFLVSGKGCALGDADKPFECKLWPYRVMRKDGELVLAVAEECPGLRAQGYALDFARGPLRTKVEAALDAGPVVVQDWRAGYRVVCGLGVRS